MNRFLGPRRRLDPFSTAKAKFTLIPSSFPPKNIDAVHKDGLRGIFTTQDIRFSAAI